MATDYKIFPFVAIFRRNIPEVEEKVAINLVITGFIATFLKILATNYPSRCFIATFTPPSMQLKEKYSCIFRKAGIYS